MEKPLSPEHALIYALVAVAAADRRITENEINRISSIVRDLPPFQDHLGDWLLGAAQDCGKLLSKPDGMNLVLQKIKTALPVHLRETAYVLAAEVAETDLSLAAEERAVLDLLAKNLELDQLVCAALERAARARHRTM
jgi:uncharacterized membrane protein YebE (DUF533 family)